MTNAKNSRCSTEGGGGNSEYDKRKEGKDFKINGMRTKIKMKNNSPEERCIKETMINLLKKKKKKEEDALQ